MPIPLPVILGLYGLPFALLACMWNWLSLTITGGVVAALLVWHWNETLFGEAAGHIAWPILVILSYIVTVGVGSGFLARAMLLAPYRSFIPAPSGAVLIAWFGVGLVVLWATWALI